MSNTMGTDGAPSNGAPTNGAPTNGAPTNSAPSVDTQPVEEMSELTHIGGRIGVPIGGRKLRNEERKTVRKIEKEAVQVDSDYERNTGFSHKRENDRYYAFLELPNLDMYYGTDPEFSRALEELLKNLERRRTW